jgi:hypothetical protein
MFKRHFYYKNISNVSHCIPSLMFLSFWPTMGQTSELGMHFNSKMPNDDFPEP